MLFLSLVTVLGLAMADTNPLCGGGECPADWMNVEGDCVMFMSGWEEDSARQVCRGLKAEFSEFFISRSDSDSATRHSLPVCLLRRETTTRGIIISGGYDSVGQSVEVYVPSTGQHCQLPDLPDRREYHTMEKMTVCGGVYSDTRTSCITLTGDGWENTTTLLEQRYRHSSWDSPAGVILMGGYDSIRTSEKIEEDGTSAYSFNMKYDTAEACAINLGSTVAITGGGDYPFNIVSEYNQEGWVRDLPSLQQGRDNHGCSYFVSDDGTKTLLVTGGFSGGYLSSTELLYDGSSSWTYSGELPTPRWGPKGGYINNKVLMTGGDYYDGSNIYYYTDILEFYPPTDPTNPRTGEWKLVANMTRPRHYHAVSVIDYSQVAQFCTED